MSFSGCISLRSIQNNDKKSVERVLLLCKPLFFFICCVKLMFQSYVIQDIGDFSIKIAPPQVVPELFLWPPFFTQTHVLHFLGTSLEVSKRCSTADNWEQLITLPLGNPRSFKHCITIFSVLPDANVRVMLKWEEKTIQRRLSLFQWRQPFHPSAQLKHLVRVNPRSC